MAEGVERPAPAVGVAGPADVAGGGVPEVASVLGASCPPACWFHGVYPAPFEHPALRLRLRVYDLVHRLAELSHRPDLRSIVALELGTSYGHLLPV